MVLYILVAWTIISLIIMIVTMCRDYFKLWMIPLLFPGAVIIYAYAIIQQIYIKIKWQSKRHVRKYK